MSVMSGLRRKLTAAKDDRIKKHITSIGNQNRETRIGYPITFTLMKIRRRNARLEQRDNFRKSKRQENE